MRIPIYGGGFYVVWWFMLICDMIIPIVMVITGRMMWKHCPKNINGMGNDYTIRIDTYSVIP